MDWLWKPPLIGSAVPEVHWHSPYLSALRQRYASKPGNVKAIILESRAWSTNLPEDLDSYSRVKHVLARRYGSLKLIYKSPYIVLLVLFLQSGARSADTIPFVPTTMPIVDRMLEIAQVTKDDVVYDMGSGDGRIVIRAAQKYGARGVGIELDPQLVEQAKEKAREAGVSHLVEFRNQDGLEADISEATVVTLYMFKWFNNALRPKLQRLKPGSRVIAHDYDIDDWEPTRIIHLDPVADKGVVDRHHTLYFWVVGEKSPQP